MGNPNDDDLDFSDFELPEDDGDEVNFDEQDDDYPNPWHRPIEDAVDAAVEEDQLQELLEGDFDLIEDEDIDHAVRNLT